LAFLWKAFVKLACRGNCNIKPGAAATGVAVIDLGLGEKAIGNSPAVTRETVRPSSLVKQADVDVQIASVIDKEDF